MQTKSGSLLFLTIALAVTLAVFLFPIGSNTDNIQTWRAFRGHNSVVMVGNSAIQHSSKCDADSRSIAQLTGDALGQPVTDLSNTAQLLDESLAYAGVALRNPHVRTIVLPLAFFSLGDDWAPSFQRASFLNLVSRNPVKFPLVSLLLSAGVSGRDLSTHVPFMFEGVAYPDYDAIKTRFFQREKDLMNCPEDDGKDRVFLKAYYHHVYVANPVLARNIVSIEKFAGVARQQGVAAKFVMLPIDLDLIRALRPTDANALRQSVDAAVKDLRTRGVDVLDLTGAVPNANFADRWCACGHLQILGRTRVANALAESLARRK